MDRDAIERRDFPTARRGYDPAAVDAHLRQVADEIERGQPSPATAPSLAAGASEQVRAILEAAEASAAQVRAEAGAEARDHLTRVQGAAGDLSAQLDHLANELDRVLSALRAGAGRLDEGLLDLRARVAEYGPVNDVRPAPPRDEDAAGERSPREGGAAGEGPPLGERAAGEGPPREGGAAGEAPPREQGAAGERRARGDGAAEEGPPLGERAAEAPPSDPTARATDEEGARSTDEEGARLAALELALSGRSRAEAERYLAAHFALTDPAALLDDVYSRAGR